MWGGLQGAGLFGSLGLAQVLVAAARLAAGLAIGLAGGGATSVMFGVAAATGVSESVTWLTDEELAARNAEINAILLRDIDRLTDPTKRPEGARLCELVAWGVPVSFGEASS